MSSEAIVHSVETKKSVPPCPESPIDCAKLNEQLGDRALDNAGVEVGIPPTEKVPVFGKTPERLMFAIKMQLKSQIGSIETSGKENLEKLPKDKKIVVVTTHISDMDIPLTINALGNDLNLMITNESVHHKFSGEPSMNISMRLIGKDNFLPIDFAGKGIEKHPTVFNPDNFEPMIKAMDGGKSMIVAGHNPSLESHLERGGYGAVYLAEMTDAIILPVSADILSEENLGTEQNKFKTFLKKPDARVQIGEPFYLNKIENVEKIKELMNKRKSGVQLTQEERLEFSDLVKALKEASQLLMKNLAKITPIEKRGDIVTE
jgi:hypothetical protein